VQTDAEVQPLGIAKIIKAMPAGLVVEIEGFTDNKPIRTLAFPSNWELSAVRATSVVRLLAENGIAPERMLAIGREASKPIAPNNTPEGRSRNRRVELMILSGLPDTIEEIQVRPNPARP